MTASTPTSSRSASPSSSDRRLTALRYGLRQACARGARRAIVPSALWVIAAGGRHRRPGFSLRPAWRPWPPWTWPTARPGDRPAGRAWPLRAADPARPWARDRRPARCRASWPWPPWTWPTARPGDRPRVRARRFGLRIGGFTGCARATGLILRLAGLPPFAVVVPLVLFDELGVGDRRDVDAVVEGDAVAGQREPDRPPHLAGRALGDTRQVGRGDDAGLGRRSDVSVMATATNLVRDSRPLRLRDRPRPARHPR